MDIREYFHKQRELENSLPPSVVIASLKTTDGGREGRLNDVPRALAAELIAAGKARLADEAETRSHREEMERARKDAEAGMAARNMPVRVLTEENMRRLKDKFHTRRR